MINIDVKVDNVREIARSLRATEQDVSASYRKALNSVRATARRKISRSLVDAVGLKREKSLRKRLFTAVINDEVLSIWVGLNRMATLALVGKIQDRSSASVFSPGASFRGVLYPGSFIGSTGTFAGLALWRRTSKTFLNERGWKRYRIEPVKIPIERLGAPVIEGLSTRYAKLVVERFEKDLTKRIIKKGT